MICHYHPNVKARAVCIKCSKNLCMDCVADSPNCAECNEKDRLKAIEQERLRKAPPLVPQRVAVVLLGCAVSSIGLSYLWALLDNSVVSLVHFAFFFFAPFGWRLLKVGFDRPVSFEAMKDDGKMQQEIGRFAGRFLFDPGQIFLFFFGICKAVLAVIIGPFAFLVLGCMYFYNLKKFRKD